MAVRSLLVVTAFAALSACAESAPLAPQPLPPLQPGVWHVHESDGQALPALLGHRLVNGDVLEQDFLDSARVEITNDGSWELRGWYQRYWNREPQLVIATLDRGTWVATPSAYEFRRNTGELLYTVPAPSSAEWQINLRYPNQEGVAVSRLRSTRPPLGLAGEYRATSMYEHPLPYAYFVEPEFDNGTTWVSHHVIIDSAFIAMRSNGSYRHVIYYSHWQGPVGGGPEVRLVGLAHTDFGSWMQQGTQLTLESGWLQNHVIRGERSANEVGPLRLNHGISHGDEPAPLRYVRR